MGDDAAAGHGAADYNGWAAQMGKMLHEEFGATLSLHSRALRSMLARRTSVFESSLVNCVYMCIYICAVSLCTKDMVFATVLRWACQFRQAAVSLSAPVCACSFLFLLILEPPSEPGSLQERPRKYASKASSRGSETEF